MARLPQAPDDLEGCVGLARADGHHQQHAALATRYRLVCVEAQLVAVRVEQRKSASRNRLAIALVVIKVLASLGWHVVQRFAFGLIVVG